MRSSNGIYYSLFLHAILLVLLIFGLPDFLHHKEEMEPAAISVDILPISQKSNVKTQEKTEKTKDKKPQPHTEKRPAPEAHPEEQASAEQPEKVSPNDVVQPPKPEPKPEPKPKPKPRPKPRHKQDSLDSILKSVEQTARADESQKPAKAQAKPEQHAAKADTYDNSQPLSMSDRDALKQQIEINWVPPIGARDAANLKVLLHIEVAQDGTVTNVQFTGDTGRYNSDSFFHAAVDSAMRAVYRSSPLKNLPADKYGGSNGWHEMELNFDPKDILN